jgi:peptide/nickel transport system ATP-binding protein
MSSLNPCYTISDQIEEAIRLHQTEDKVESRKRPVDVLTKVGMPNPARIADSFPHELSGGMRQRAMIAMALLCAPTLLIADEPTTALDVTTEANILDLMRELQSEIGTSIMFITHNMGVVAQMCDEVAVMYLGRVVERATVDDIFYEPQHPYTIALLQSIPRLGRTKGRLASIEGSVPDPYSRVNGCPFHPRCPVAIKGVCDTILPKKPSSMQPRVTPCAATYTREAPMTTDDMLLEVRGVKKHFPDSLGFFTPCHRDGEGGRRD